MRKSFKTFVACILVVSFFSAADSANGMLSVTACAGHDILIQPCPPIPQEAPRTPILNPFYATLETNYVLLGSQCEYGVVEVTMVSTAGDDYSTEFDTEDGTIVIPISGMSGQYTLTLVTEGGNVFVGEFVI